MNPDGTALRYNVGEGGSKAMSKLRDDIRKYEEEKGTEVRCLGGMIRCLSCPMSAVGCPLARLKIK
jgi:hypothetical protein